MIVTFTEAELQKITEWALERRRSHKKGSSRKIASKRSDLEIDTLGIKGEYVIHQRFGGKWNRHWANGVMPKWDIERGDFRCEVKTSFWPEGEFKIKPWETFHADVGYLVIDEPPNVRIAGCLTREMFDKIAVKRNMGHSDIPRVVDQKDLLDPETYFLKNRKL